MRLGMLRPSSLKWSSVMMSRSFDCGFGMMDGKGVDPNFLAQGRAGHFVVHACIESAKLIAAGFPCGVRGDNS